MTNGVSIDAVYNAICSPHSVVDGSMCITVTQPSILNMHAFYNFMITDLSLAIGTLMVAFLTCIHTYKKIWEVFK